MRIISRLLPLLIILTALPLHATITGSVMNSDGQAIAGAKIMLFGPETVAARRDRLASKTPEHAPAVTATADSNGNFKIDPPKDLPVVDVRIDAPGYAPDTLRLQSDDEAGAVVLTKAASKSGTVTANGKPVAGATVILQGGTSGFITATDDKGRYTVPDPSKWATLMLIVHPDFARLTEVVQLAKKDLDRTLVPGVKVAGKVVGADGATGVADAVIDIDGWPAGKSGADGAFSFDHAPKGWTEVRAVKGNLIAAHANGAGPFTLKLTKGATISGSVRDVKTQLPLAGADVQISLGTPRGGGLGLGLGVGAFASAQTDAKGNYTLSPLAAGSYMLNVARPNYMVPNTSMQLAAGQSVSKPLFGTAVARISGTVVDEDKRPVAAARVESERAGRNGNFMIMNFRPGAQARVAFSGPDGRFVARVTELDTDVHIGAVKKGFPATKSSIMRFASGERKSGLTLTIPRGVAFTGRVLDKSGKPVSGVAVDASESQSDAFGANVRRMVMAATRGGSGEENVTTAADGTFTVRLKEGKYDVVFKREGFSAKVMRAQQVAANGKPVEVVLEPGVEVSGRVSRGGVGVEGVTVSGMSEGGGGTVTTGPDGTFTLSDLTPGQMMVMANKPDSMIQEMRSITAPAQNVNIEVPVGGRITGRVVDKATHNPITSFQAGVSTSRGAGGMMVVMPPMLKPFTSDDGTFTLENIKPGPTQVVAMAAGYTTGRAPTIEVEDGKAVTDVEVPLEAGAKLAGRVTDASGAPVAGVSVRPEVMGAGGRMMRFDATEVSGSTDPNGEYTLDGIEPGDHTFTFTRSGYVEESKSFTVAAGKDNRLDVVMGSGLHFTGQVVLDGGAPVSEATVRASSAAGGFREAHTDASGMFQLDGLTPGHYDFTASKSGLANGITHDVDISAQNNVRIVMKGGGTITGHVTGLTDHDLEQTTVIATSPNGSASSPVDSTGAYRIDGAPNGTVRVTARTGQMMGAARSAPPQTIDLEAGASATVDIQFKSDTTISGRVTLNNQPLSNVNINFLPRQGKTQTASGAPVGSDGRYQIVGLDDGPYTVQVMDMRTITPYTTTYEVHGSGTFDIDMHTAQVRGHVLDGATGQPIDRAQIEVRSQSTDTAFFSTRGAQTDSTGAFLIDNVAVGNYQITANKEGYGQELRAVIVSDSSSDPVEIKLNSTTGVTLNVVDGRDGTMLNANVTVSDLQGNPISGDNPLFRGMTGGSGEPVKLSLAPGQYRVTVDALHYARKSLVVASPSTQTVALTPGGTLLIHSKGTGLRGRLIDSSGMSYAGFGPLMSGAFPLLNGTTTLSNIASGHYRLDILDAGDNVIKSIQIDVVEGQPADYTV